VTRKNDSKAPKDELTFKCSIGCQADDTICQGVANAANVYWYSNSQLILTTSLLYDNSTKQFYSFLNETTWTNYLNTNVNILKNLNFKNFSLKLDLAFQTNKDSMQIHTV